MRKGVSDEELEARTGATLMDILVLRTLAASSPTEGLRHYSPRNGRASRSRPDEHA